MSTEKEYIVGFDRESQKVRKYNSEEDAEMYAVKWHLMVNSSWSEAKKEFEEMYQQENEE